MDLYHYKKVKLRFFFISFNKIICLHKCSIHRSTFIPLIKINIYTFIYYNFYRSLLLYILININKTSRSVLLKLERNEYSHKNEKKNTQKHYHTQKRKKIREK
jgi:hypothetical protein